MLKKFSPPTILATLLFSVTATQALGAEQLAALQLNEEDFFTDFPVVLTATRLKQPQKESPIATTIIDRKMIEASGFTEVADLLRLAPNMIVNYDSGHTPAAGYSFLLTRYTVRMQVMIDGRSVYTPIFGEMYWSSLGITVDDIERIEVIRGPSSSSYGPNAMTGVISIITRNASTEPNGSVTIKSGKNGIEEQHYHQANTLEDMSYRLSLAARKHHGFEGRYDNADIKIVNLKTSYQLTNNDEMELNLAYNKGTFQEDNVFSADDYKDNPYDNTNPPHLRETTNESYQLKWTHTFSKNNSLSLNYYQQVHDDENDYIGYWERLPGGPSGADPLYPGSFPVDTQASIYSKRRNLEFAHLLSGDNYKFIWGAIHRTDETVAPLYLYNVDDNKVETSEVYFNSTYNLNKDNIFNLSYLVDDNDIADRTHSSRISFNHHINQNHTLRTSYATATRTPFIFEEKTNYYYEDVDAYVQSLGYPANLIGYGGVDYKDLEEEKIKSYDIGLVSSIDNTNIDLRLFRSKLTNLIYIDEYTASGIDYPYFANGDEFRITGLELSIDQKFDNAWYRLNYAHNKIDKIVSIMDDADTYRDATPFHNLSLITGYNISSNTSANLNYYYTGDKVQVISGRHQDAQYRLDFKLSHKFNLSGLDADASLMVFNLTDKEHVIEFRPDTYTINGTGRSGYLGLTVHF